MKIEAMEKTLKTLVDKIHVTMPLAQLQDDKDQDAPCMVNGINIMRLPSRDAYSFALLLMDQLFTKEEMGESLLFKSKKSDKPGLDEQRVQKLLSYVEKRYSNGWDMKTLTAKANQKCRDANSRVLDN